MSQLGIAGSFCAWLRRAEDHFAQVGFVAAVLLGMGSVGLAQSESVAIADLLGPHGDGARGCGVCHAARSAALVSDPGADGKAQTALWGSNTTPEYGGVVPLADESRMVEVRPAAMPGGHQDVAGILLCLSCHDGNITPQNMLQPWSYESQMGLLASTAYRSQKIPSLLGRDESPAVDHPLGPVAPITPGSGLVFSNGTFSVIPGSPYARFVANYGWPSLSPGKRSHSYGVSHSGEPYALCTTCHDQHVRNVFRSGTGSPIAGDGGGKFYATSSFLNGPYNSEPDMEGGHPTTSSVQFCRQCHFDLANEGNNTSRPTVVF